VRGLSPRRGFGGWLGVVVALLLLAATVSVAVDAESGAAESSAGRRPRSPEADRVLVISLPHVSWSDLAQADVPNLRRLLRSAALANMTTRTLGSSTLASGYLTFGAGTRADAPDIASDGAGFGANELVGDDRAADVFYQQTGATAADGIVHLGLASILDINEGDDVDARVGALGDALDRVGVARAVIGNADSSVLGSDDTAYGRFLVSGLMGSDGRVPAGRIDETLLRDDPASPFGVRLDENEVVEVFQDAWSARSVVIVEASDLARVAAVAPITTEDQHLVERRAAIRRADALVGQLLESVDLDRDAVIVISPAPNMDGNRLTVAALRAPGREPGLMRTASTRRTGYVLLADIAPTILDVLGLRRASEMQGRPFQVEGSDDSLDGRLDFLQNASTRAAFRDRVRIPVLGVFIGLQAVLAVVTVLLLRRESAEQWRRRLAFFALGVLMFVPSVYLVRLLPTHDWGIGAYFAVLAASTVFLTFVVRWLARQRVIDSLLLALGTLVAVLIVDVVSGARLQLDSAFGYGPTVGVRIAGFGNASFAALAAASLLLAGLLAHRLGGRRGVIAALAVLTAAVIVDANPSWGSDVGGVITLGVAAAVTTVLLIGREVRLRGRVIAIGVGAAVAALLAATAIDLTRPRDQRTHLGRLVDQIRDDGPSALTDVLVRKLGRNLATVVSSEWLMMLVVVLPFIAYLVYRSPVRVGRIVETFPELRAALIGFAIAATLGYATNDTGVVVPGVMLGILNAMLVVIVLAELAPRAGRAVRSRRP